MFLTSKHLSRRAMLKGLGATVGAAVSRCDDSRRQSVGSGARKKRFIAIEMVHGAAGSTVFGLQKNMWSPAAAGREFDLAGTSLAPLEPFRHALTIVSHTDCRSAEAFAASEIGADHFRSSAVFLTQMHPKQTQGPTSWPARRSTRSTQPRIGQETPIPSMQLCIENIDQAGGCSYNYSCVYTDSISWASPTQPLPMIRDPRVVFDQFFGVGATPAARLTRRRQDRSILDWVTDAVGELKLTLGACRSRASERLPGRCPRNRAAHSEGRGVQRERRATRAAGGADRCARLVRGTRQADVRSAGGRLRLRHDARLRV